MKSRYWPLVAVLLILLSSVGALALVVSDTLTAAQGGARPRPWDIRGIVKESIRDILESDETRVMIESLVPQTTFDKEALVTEVISAISTSPEARKALKDALYTPEAREAFAAALKSPEAEKAIRELLSSPQMRRLVTDLVRESMRQGY